MLGYSCDDIFESYILWHKDRKKDTSYLIQISFILPNTDLKSSFFTKKKI